MFACICVARAKKEQLTQVWTVKRLQELMCENHIHFDFLFTLNEPANLWTGRNDSETARRTNWSCFLFSPSGMMMRKMEREQHSDRTTGPCCPISAHRPKEATKTLLTGRTDSSATGGWKASTRSEDRRGFSIFQTHPRTDESFPETGGIPNISR